MKVESLIKITIGETAHEITMDEARSLFAELQKLFLSSPPNDGLRDAIQDALGYRRWRPSVIPLRVYPGTLEAAEDGSPV
jgi:hypothetical protein